METWKQLLKWPPTKSTVIGLGVLAGMLDYLFTGSWAQAATIGGFVQVLCPEERDAIAKAEQILRQLEPPGGPAG